MHLSGIYDNGANAPNESVFVSMPDEQRSTDCTVVTMPTPPDSSSSDDTSEISSVDNQSQGFAPRSAEYGAKEVDDLLSKEMYSLTFADRSAISEEIHGVRCLAPEETPELLRGSLIELQQHIDLIPFKPAYDKAQEFAQDPEFSKTSYVNTLDFRLKFLRCELFHAPRAAVRLVKFLDLMLELYGIFALQRTVKLSDFSKQEMQILRAGYFQMFPFRDRSGRRIMSIVGNMGAEYDPFVRMKSYMYFWMAAAEDVESQQKGVVFLVWPGTSQSIKNIPCQKERMLHMKCNGAAPIRIAAVHFCFPNEPFYHFLRSIHAMSMGRAYRLRLKFHVGEGMELQYRLKSYGIPVDLIPITDTGNIKTTHLKQWMRLRKIVEVGMTPDGTKTNEVSIVECPRSNDVIFRPGTSMLCHPGNVVFRGLIESKQDRITVKRAEKEEVALEIIREVEKSGGRFLIWDNGGWWSEAKDVDLICTKIAISYRDFKTKVQSQNQNKQQIDSSTFFFVNQDHGKKRKRLFTKNECASAFSR